MVALDYLLQLHNFLVLDCHCLLQLSFTLSDLKNKKAITIPPVGFRKTRLRVLISI